MSPIRIRMGLVTVGAMAVALLGGARSPAGLAAHKPNPAPSLDFIAGTWVGTSTCVGIRGACKDETIVYRFIAVEGHPGQVRQLADKILDGKRVPMGALEYEVDTRNGTVRCEFTHGPTHGVWSYKVVGDSLTGALTLLPDGTKRRDVKAHRATERDVPKAPPLSDYEE